MLKLSDLTVAERGKIAPGLWGELKQAQRLKAWPAYASRTIRYLDALGRIDCDLWIEKVDGTKWYLRERNIPTSWLIDHWTDFVVKLTKMPYVVQVGTMKELPIIGAPIVPGGATEVYSPVELLNVASRAPEETISPDPNPNPYQPPVDDTGGGDAGGGDTGGGDTGGGGGYTGGGGYGGYRAGGVAELLQNPMLWFGLLAGGALLILVLGRRKAPEREPEVFDFEED